MQHEYYEGQRAEGVWVGKNVVTVQQLRHLASQAHDAVLYIMSNLLGWQEVPYEK